MFVRHKISSLLTQVPMTPGVYAMYERKGDNYATYVGISKRLRSRLRQHMIRRDSSVTTNVSAVSLNPDYIEQIKWWVDDRFEEREVLEAAELVAFDILNPVLRSRGRISEGAKSLYQKDNFKEEMINIFEEEPSGNILIPSLNEVIERIESIEKRLNIIEQELQE